MSHNIIHLFLDAAKLHPHQIAIMDAHESISFADLEKSVLAKATYFKSKNIQLLL